MKKKTQPNKNAVNNQPAAQLEPMKTPPLSKINFTLMIISAVVIIVGFALMLGGSSTTSEFNPDIFSTRRIAVGPTIAFLGFIFMGIAIIYRPKDKTEKPQELTESGHD